MKNVFIIFAALITQLSAHPGPAGHTHAEGEDWPFAGGIEWGMLILGLAALAYFIKKGRV